MKAPELPTKIYFTILDMGSGYVYTPSLDDNGGTEYIRKDALIEWLRKEYETVSWYDEKMRHVTRCVGDTSSSGKAQAYKSVIDKLNSM